MGDNEIKTAETTLCNTLVHQYRSKLYSKPRQRVKIWISGILSTIFHVVKWATYIGLSLTWENVQISPEQSQNMVCGKRKEIMLDSLDKI